MGFVEFPRLILVGNCLREAGAGGSNPLTPTIYLSNYTILVEHCLFCVHVDDKVFTKAASISPIRTVPRYTHLRAEDLVGGLGTYYRT